MLSRLKQTHGENKNIKFIDECEWRFVPPGGVNSVRPAIVAKPHFDIDSHNDALENCGKYWIPFDYSDIKYLILPDVDGSIRFMNYCKTLKIPEKDRNVMYTKIIIWQDFREDV
jgi:hypothetical protein